MTRTETTKAGLPVPTGPSTRPPLLRATAPAAFLSQLIAERHHLAPQRARRQAPIADALETYDRGGRMSIRRLPPGYRMAIDA